MIKVYHRFGAFFTGWSMDEHPPADFPAGYEHVADVDAGLEKAFELTNTIDRLWQENKEVTVHTAGQRARSTSVGDVFVEENGTRHFICSVGFKTF